MISKLIIKTTRQRQRTSVSNLNFERIQNIKNVLSNIKHLSLQKMKFSIKDFFSKCDQIRSFLRIWSHLLKNPKWKTSIFVQYIILPRRTVNNNTVKPRNSEHMWVLKNLSVIERTPLLGRSLRKTVTFGTI